MLFLGFAVSCAALSVSLRSLGDALKEMPKVYNTQMYPTLPILKNEVFEEPILSGLCFSAYEKNRCRDPEIIKKQIVMLSKVTTRIRIYSIDCDQLELVLQTIHTKNLTLQVLAGIWTRSETESLSDTLNQFTKILKMNPSFPRYISGVVVGNEDILNGQAEEVVIGNINQARAHFQSTGSPFQIGTAEISQNWSPKLVEACDIIYANIYSFFDEESRNKGMATATRLVIDRANDIPNQGKPVIVSETGWPSDGETASHTSYARPTTINQGRYLENFACQAAKNNLTYYIMEAFDADWKEGPTVEQNFGLMTPDGKLKFTRFRSSIQC